MIPICVSRFSIRVIFFNFPFDSEEFTKIYNVIFEKAQLFHVKCKSMGDAEKSFRLGTQTEK